jgi:hypothetical protein
VTHFREHFDSPYIGHWDLNGADVVVTIASVKPGTVEGEKGRKDKKAIVQLKEFKKPWACNITNCKTIAGMYGQHVEQWVGKQVALFEDTTKSADGKTVPCIRVRPMVPRGAPAQRERPKGPVHSATTREELLAAIASSAATISEQHEKAWPVVLERCKELGLSEEDALEQLAKHTPKPAGGAA